jgi:hypothetical protein
LLDGLGAGVIDYDARRRDTNIECSPAAAIMAMRRVSDRLREDPRLHNDRPLIVRMEDAAAGNCHGLLPSSLSRELQALRSHTIHHFALIAMTLQLWGVAVDSDFGVAPSTLRCRAAGVRDAA